MKIKNYIRLGLIMLGLLTAACLPPAESTQTSQNGTHNTTRAGQQPTIEASPVETGEGNYKIVAGDDFNLTVGAPDASEVELFYQPIIAGDRAVRLKTLTAPTDSSKGNFVTNLKIPEDFNGEVWARVKYAGGETRDTEHLLLAKRDEPEKQAIAAVPTNSNRNANKENSNTAAKNQVPDTDDSTRSDKFTGGRIERAALKAGDGDIRITVNVPAFTMTLWQNDQEIKSYFVGVGLKDYPIPIGMRSADKIILNPNWIPPDSEWVRKSSEVEPYQKITADDPLNPLGKIKIPLGQAYLLHEAQSPADIGNLVSHGCVRVLRDDLFEMTRMIAEARKLSISKEEIASARKNTERRVISLDGSIPVDINYDSVVVENGVLTIYPDVYERKTNTVENLRAELRQFNVDAAKIDDPTLKEMLEKVTGDRKFVVALSDIRAGNAIAKGKTEPLTPQQGKGGGKNS